MYIFKAILLSLSIQNVGTVLVLVILTRKAEATYTYKCIHGNSIALVGLVGRKSTKKGLSLGNLRATAVRIS